MKVYLATDHAGFDLKESLKAFLITSGYEVEDCGAFTLEGADDYPPFISAAAKKVVQTPGAAGIVFGKSGAGETIVANKIKGTRAILGINEENVKLARLHNDANIMALGSAFITPEVAENLAKNFLETKFTGESRHIRRIEQIKQIEAE
jgi:ribose 5-phosphate isomerase B